MRNAIFIALFFYFSSSFTWILFIFALFNKYVQMANKDINRIKVILVEKKKTAKWLAGELGKDPATVSKWCTNVSQPSLDTLVDVSNALDVDIRELLVSTKEEPKYIRVE